jgi:uncharacterized coiled-coil protein SlyX
MKKLLAVSLATLALTLAFSTGAEATCNVTCLNHRVSSLGTALIKAQKKIAAQGQTIADLSQQVSAQNQVISSQQNAVKKATSAIACMFEVPISEYGEPEEGEGYLYENSTETFQTTALDVPFKGEFVGAWFLIDGCNTATTASVQSASALAPRATNLRTLLQPQKLRFP